MLTKAQAYTQFATWLERQHPDVFSVLLSQSQRLSGLAVIYRGRFADRRESARQAFGDYYLSATDISDLATTFDTSTDLLPEITVTADAGGGATLIDSLDSGPSIADQVSAQTAIATANPITTPIETAVPTDVTAAIPTAPVSPPSSAASTVGQTLVNNTGLLRSALNAANTVITSNAAAAVITAQAQRAAAGLAPANVSYIPVTDSSTGQVSTVPVLNTASGQLPLSTSGINALAPATFLQNYGLYIMLGLAALVVAWE
jgi:hypothetical protein